MFGKTKKLFAELNKEILDLKTMIKELKSKNYRLGKVNDDMSKELTKAHKDLAEATLTIDTLKRYKDAFEGSLMGIGSLLEEEAPLHKKQTEYMRGLRAAKYVLEVYVDADKDNT